MGLNYLAIGGLGLQWAVTGQVPDVLSQVFPIGQEARSISGVAKQYYMYGSFKVLRPPATWLISFFGRTAIAALAYGHLALGLLALLSNFVGTNGAKATFCLVCSMSISTSPPLSSLVCRRLGHLFG